MFHDDTSHSDTTQSVDADPAGEQDSSESFPTRCLWVVNNPDIVATIHAIRVELIVTILMSEIVPGDAAQPFSYWLRFEWGKNGNPHTHGQAWVPGNPRLDKVFKDAATRTKYQTEHPDDSIYYPTWDEAEQTLCQFFTPYISEMHPCKDAHGNRLYDYHIETLSAAQHCQQPLCTNLHQEIATAFSEDPPNLSRLRDILLALIEQGQRHTSHGHSPPKLGEDACARKGSKSCGPDCVDCRYLFPRDLRVNEDGLLGAICEDPHRPDLRNLSLERNDTLLNNHQEELLLGNVGNIDWRALINLWTTLEYLTKYNAKAGQGSRHLGRLFEDVLDKVYRYEEEDGLHDLWRRTILKFYNRILGDRDYSLLECMHFALQIPGSLSSFPPVVSVSVSNWTSVKNPSVRTPVTQTVSLIRANSNCFPSELAFPSLAACVTRTYTICLFMRFGGCMM